MIPSPLGDPTATGSPSQQHFRGRAWASVLLAAAPSVLLVAFGPESARPAMPQPAWRWSR